MNTDLRDSYGTTETNLMPDVEAVEISCQLDVCGVDRTAIVMSDFSKEVGPFL